MVSLPYTLCFCLRGSQVLMLYRSNPPNTGFWNGLGGKITAGETPCLSVKREIMEEAGLDLEQTGTLHFTGIVTWAWDDDPTRPGGGMYTFLAHLDPKFPIWPDRLMDEGLLSWKELAWVCDPNNPEIVSNIPRFLPLMLQDPRPREYHGLYRAGVLWKMIVKELSLEITDVCTDRLPDS